MSDDPTNSYDEAYNNLIKLKAEYDEAVLEGDESKIGNATERYARSLSDAVQLAYEKGDFDVEGYFEAMHPDMQVAVGTWQFDVDLEANTHELENRVKSSLKALEGFSTEDLKLFNANTATDEQIIAYGQLQAIADNYGISVQYLFEHLQKLKLVQSEAYQELSKLFGEESIQKLTSDELEIGYTIKNVSGMSFEEFRNAIKEEKEAIEEAKLISFNKAWKDTADETRRELLELAKAGEISEETLESTEKYNHLLSQTGMSAKRVKNNITNMLTTQEKLSAFSNGMSSLKSAYRISR